MIYLLLAALVFVSIVLWSFRRDLDWHRSMRRAYLSDEERSNHIFDRICDDIGRERFGRIYNDAAKEWEAAKGAPDARD